MNYYYENYGPLFKMNDYCAGVYDRACELGLIGDVNKKIVEVPKYKLNIFKDHVDLYINGCYFEIYGYLSLRNKTWNEIKELIGSELFYLLGIKFYFGSKKLNYNGNRTEYRFYETRNKYDEMIGDIEEIDIDNEEITLKNMRNNLNI